MKTMTRRDQANLDDLDELHMVSFSNMLYIGNNEVILLITLRQNFIRI